MQKFQAKTVKSDAEPFSDSSANSTRATSVTVQGFDGIYQAAGNMALQRQATIRSSLPRPVIQKFPADRTITESSPTAETPVTPAPAIEESAAEAATPTPRLIVENNKSQFLSEVRRAVCEAIDPIIAAAGRSTDGCPYLGPIFAFLERRSAAYIEGTLRRFAPNLRNSRTASEYIPAIVKHACQITRHWLRTGEITGLPAGLPTTFLLTGAWTSGGTTTAASTAQAKAKAGGARLDRSPEAIRDQLGSGRSLDSSAKSRMESAFGQGFSNVRIHTDAKSEQLSEDLNARAFTIGSNIAFGQGEYQPGTLAGDALIAHELAHVVQQSAVSASDKMLQQDGTVNSILEADADRSALGAMAALWAGAKYKFTDIAQNAVPRFKSGLKVQRCRKSQRCETSGEEYWGPGGWLHCYVFERIQEESIAWQKWATDLVEKWGEEVPVVGHLGGAVMGVVPYVTGKASEMFIAIPQSVTPKSHEEHALEVMTFGTGTPAIRIRDGMKYGWWSLKNYFTQNPKAEKELSNFGEKAVKEAFKQAEKVAPEKMKLVPAKRLASETTKRPPTGEIPPPTPSKPGQPAPKIIAEGIGKPTLKKISHFREVDLLDIPIQKRLEYFRGWKTYTGPLKTRSDYMKFRWAVDNNLLPAKTAAFQVEQMAGRVAEEFWSRISGDIHWDDAKALGWKPAKPDSFSTKFGPREPDFIPPIASKRQLTPDGRVLPARRPEDALFIADTKILEKALESGKRVVRSIGLTDQIRGLIEIAAKTESKILVFVGQKDAKVTQPLIDYASKKGVTIHVKEMVTPSGKVIKG